MPVVRRVRSSHCICGQGGSQGRQKVHFLKAPIYNPLRGLIYGAVKKVEILRGGDMPNEQNLVPIQSGKEARERGRKGGIASGVSRRRKRSLREAADLYLSLPVASKKKWNVIAKEGVDPEDIDNQMAVIAGLTLKAAKGDAKAAKVLFDLLGEPGGKDNEGEEVKVVIDV